MLLKEQAINILKNLLNSIQEIFLNSQIWLEFIKLFFVDLIQSVVRFFFERVRK